VKPENRHTLLNILSAIEFLSDKSTLYIPGVFYFILFYFILFYFILFYFIYFILFHFISFHFISFFLFLLYSVPLRLLFVFLKIRYNLVLCIFFLLFLSQVNITLDEKCKHPSLTIKEKNRVMSSTQKEIPPKAMVVANEGFSEKKHYWEVEVGDKPEWALGVVCEEIRNALRSNSMNTFPKGYLLSLQFSQGEYSLTGEVTVRTCKPCSVVGVFLDQELQALSFFDVEEKCLLESLSFEFSGILYPFFSPGSDGKWLGVRPVNM